MAKAKTTKKTGKKPSFSKPRGAYGYALAAKEIHSKFVEHHEDEFDDDEAELHEKIDKLADQLVKALKKAGAKGRA